MLHRQARRLGLGIDVLGPFAPGYDAGVEAADWVISARASAVIAFDDQMALACSPECSTA